MLRVSLLLLFACDLALFAIGHEHHHEHIHHHVHDHDQESPSFKYSREANVEPNGPGTDMHGMKHNLRTESPQQLWMETGGAVVLISVAPFLLLFLLPDLNKHERLLKVLLAFAAGGLLGDAFLHLIPHAVDRQRHHSENAHASHDHRHHMVVGLSVVAGIFVFLFIEKLIRLIQHHTGHSHAIPQPSSAAANADTKGKKGKKGVNADETSQRRDKKPSKIKPEFRVAGYLNLAADFTHNFTDGLAIGASFLISRNLGVVTTLTVLFHELPHEIGDYAILIQSGCSARKAMCLQLITALGAILGASLSLIASGVGLQTTTGFGVPLLTNDELINSFILPFTAGGFIYIAMTSVLPDLLSSAHETEGSKRPACGMLARLIQNVAEVIALVVGIGMVAALGAME